MYVYIYIYAAGDHVLTESEAHWQACGSPCILCHNDPQPLNFIQTPDGMIVYTDNISTLHAKKRESACVFTDSRKRGAEGSTL